MPVVRAADGEALGSGVHGDQWDGFLPLVTRKALSASSSTLTRPVREAVSTTANTSAASTAAVMAPQIRSGAMRALVNTGARRVALLPDVPTALELGLAGVEFYLWVGIFSQPATPAAEREAWRQSTAAVAKDPEMLRQLEAAGLELDHRDGKAFQDFLDADFARVQAAVNRIGRVE